MRPHLRANDRQRESVREELKAIIDRCMDAWPAIDKQANEMGRGYPTGGEGSGQGGSPTENMALNPTDDPALTAQEWLAQLTELRGQAKLLDSKRVRCMAVEPTKGRVNTVDLCSECSLPLVGKIKRLDNTPLHNEYPGTDPHGHPLAVCFWAVYRRSGRNSATG